MRRYVIVGAGAVGGALGGALALAGCEIALVARGTHLAALRERGLRLVTPERSVTLQLPAFASAREADVEHCDAVIVATKSGDTMAALAGLPRRTPIFCAQNGVANERSVAERFEHAYGMLVFAPLSHLAPGVVTMHHRLASAVPPVRAPSALPSGPSAASTPVVNHRLASAVPPVRAPSAFPSGPSAASTPVVNHSGGIDVGRWPDVVDMIALCVVDDLVRAGFDARARHDIARWKYGKLLTNLGNVLEALGGRAALRGEWIATLNAEAEACLRAAKIAFVPVSEIHARFADVREVLPRGGGSTWQSLARGVPLETEYLNGEIVGLGRTHGIATPMNDALVALATRATAERWAPGARTLDELSAWLPGAAPSRAPI